MPVYSHTGPAHDVRAAHRVTQHGPHLVARSVDFGRGAAPETYHAIDQADYVGIWAMTPDGFGKRQLFTMEGSPDGFVGADSYASRGWAEERISWTNAELE